MVCIKPTKLMVLPGPTLFIFVEYYEKGYVYVLFVIDGNFLCTASTLICNAQFWIS